ncbi:AGAP012508-PA, partial [Anopheles gambiae str. PEST]
RERIVTDVVSCFYHQPRVRRRRVDSGRSEIVEALFYKVRVFRLNVRACEYCYFSFILNSPVNGKRTFLVYKALSVLVAAVI